MDCHFWNNLRINIWYDIHKNKRLNKRIANDNDLFHFGIKVDGEYPHKHIGDIQYKANEGDVYWAVRDY